MGHFRRPLDGRHLVILPGTAQKLLLAQATLADLKQRYPARPLDVMAPAALTGLASRFPEVDRVWNLPEPNMGWKLYWRAGIDLQGQGYSRAWVLPDRFKPALIPALANIPERTGYRGMYRYSLLIDIRLPRKDLHPHPLDRYRALAHDIGEPLPAISSGALKTDTERQETLLREHGLTTDQPILAWCPGSLHVPEPGRRQAPAADHWQLMLQQALDAGWQIWLFGSRHEQLEIDHLLQQMDQGIREQLVSMVGKLPWEDVVDLLSLASLQLGQDNPLALLGRACQLPVCLPVQGDSCPTAENGLAARLGATWMQILDWPQKLQQNQQ
ncbi:lipopolysaccharide heptosyltransferase II [Marinospirillum alkaliphilum]|uniref:lipopolysaccharide heptosyltransferase II n=1 Tax=Marinospirillum alkaliphilum DSM 21637 TaxID=1122209 RepID=A0A1K1VY96_9GAMM|nr:lipopolysaccharide heptosyltransferase II [Marinospirillum alkaliphilum]SFX29565.1 heptosyltransferase-2 [Marinospirillum alkaliphilum DSM 21637]